jgi:hypothetical protein
MLEVGRMRLQILFEHVSHTRDERKDVCTSQTTQAHVSRHAYIHNQDLVETTLIHTCVAGEVYEP